jgi:hypothetical protein
MCFYGHHFIGHWPADTEVMRVSGTVGADQVVDEVVVSFTHDVEMYALLPGVEPTVRFVRLAHCVVVKQSSTLHDLGRKPRVRFLESCCAGVVKFGKHAAFRRRCSKELEGSSPSARIRCAGGMKGPPREPSRVTLGRVRLAA